MAASLTKHATSIWCLTSLFICSHVDWKPALSKIFTLETVFEKIIYVFGDHFWKDVFLVTVFTRYVWTVGHTGEKNLFFPTKTDTCGRGPKTNKCCWPQRCLSKKELTELLYIMFHPTCLVVIMSLCETAVQDVHAAELQHLWNKHNQCSPQGLGNARGHSDKILI